MIRINKNINAWRKIVEYKMGNKINRSKENGMQANDIGENVESFDSKIAFFDEKLCVNVNFDVVRKMMILCDGRRAMYYYINAFGNSEITEKLMEFLMREDDISFDNSFDKEYFAGKMIPFAECSTESDLDKALYFVMSGTSLLIVEGVDGVIVLDTRRYSTRGVQEPANDRTLRGPREGFVEPYITNIGLIRRRVRDSNFRVKKMTVGRNTKTDIAICYLENKADKNLLNNLEASLDKINVNSINMGLESIAELIAGGKSYNPFPRIRYTERPDAACAMIMEGSIILVCDNYPSVMILPTTFFSFAQDTNDYYFTPPIGRYLKAVRLCVYAISLLLTPIWYLLISEPSYVPQWLNFILPSEPGNIPILLQLIGIEVCIDGLKLASLNTPDTMSNSLGIIGGLLLGDFAVKTGWLCNETIFYMSFISIANFTQPNFELGYAFKFMRILTLILISLLSGWGLLLGIVITLILIATTPSIKGSHGYLYPLIPFNGRALYRLLFRASLKNSEKAEKKNG